MTTRDWLVLGVIATGITVLVWVRLNEPKSPPRRATDGAGIDRAEAVVGYWVCQDPYHRGSTPPTILILREDGTMVFGLLQYDGSVVGGSLLTRGSWNLDGSRIDLYGTSGDLVEEADVHFRSDGYVTHMTFAHNPCELDQTGRYRSIY